MKKLMYELGQDGKGQKTSGPQHHYQRIRFALGRTTRNEFFEELEEQNKRLKRLLEISNRADISTARKSHLQTPTTKALKLAQRRAATLYNLIADAWNCGCKSSHWANLRLQEKNTGTTSSNFEIVFLYSKDNDTHTKPWTYRDTSIRIVEKSSYSTGTIREPSLLAPPAMSRGNHISAFQRSKARFKNGIQHGIFSHVQSTKHKKFVSTTETPTLQLGNVIEPRPVGRSDISNLCSILTQHNSLQELEYYGILHDSQDDYQVFAYSSMLTTKNVDQVPLRVLLDGTITTRLSVRERFTLAAAIARSDAQFWSTPWLPESIAKDTIYFLNRQDRVQSFTPRELFLAKSFTGKERQKQPGSKAENDRRLTSLGILLLELCYRITLETFIQQKLPMLAPHRDLNIDKAAAIIWSQDVCDDYGPLYASAVEWCLLIGQTTVAPTDDWYLKVYENVALPLQECCATWD